MAKPQLTPALHKEQIEAYRGEFPRYKIYAATLQRVLETACKLSFPEALIQSRPKSVSSFAEKAARKFDKYPDAVYQMTDLCGARVIVQTTEQVKAVRQFIEANFVIVEKDDKSGSLSEDRFGYRDMHYIVQWKPERDAALGVAGQEREAIGDRRAEIQVRTWVQHAWADTLHDRIYKNKLTLSPEIRRAGNLLAALMEEGDRNFNFLADELDGLIANYAAYTTKDDVEKEIQVQELLLVNDDAPGKKAALSLSLARLFAAKGDCARVAALLEPHSAIAGPIRCEFLLELGYALCRLHRDKPVSPDYQRGLKFLQEATGLCACEEVPFVPHLRKRESQHARAYARLGWACEGVPGEEHRARECWQHAHEHEPANPYYLASMLGLEMHYTHGNDLPAPMRTTIGQALKTCLQHAGAGIELPYAYFTAGRLSLLLEEPNGALGYYARGVWHYRDGKYCVPADLLAVEIDWLRGISSGRKLPLAYQNVVDLLTLATTPPFSGSTPTGKPAMPTPVLIIAGGAASMDSAAIAGIQPLLETGLAEFRGTVIAGGTTSGVPGCAGDVAGNLAKKTQKRFRLVGYLPENLPTGISQHPQYDDFVTVGGGFGAEQILRNWRDILAAGIDPSQVLLLGLGGGPISAVEYRVALAMGASVGVVTGTQGAAEALTEDLLWSTLPRLYPLPNDPMTVRAFILPSERTLDAATLEKMAREFHACYVAGNTKALPEKLKPWDLLNDDYQRANIEQAACVVQILQAAGFGVRPTTTSGGLTGKDFETEEVELMAKLEHGRWNVERLRSGWRFGPRDDARQRHNCLVPWETLPDGPEGVRKYDRNAVYAFPEILAKAGLEVYRVAKGSR